MMIRGRRKYQNVLCLDGRAYVGRSAGDGEHVELGPLAAHVTHCLAELDHGQPYDAPRLGDRGATWLPAGTPVYEVVGHSRENLLAACFHGRLHLYRPHPTRLLPAIQTDQPQPPSP